MDENWSTTEQHSSQPDKKGKRRPNHRYGSSPLSNSTAPEELAEYVFRVLARDDDSGLLHFEREEIQPGHTRLTATCDPSVTGRLIGRDGKTISALRLLIRAAAGRFDKRVDVEIT
jgi:predicted RNA-binding protein YlqC (UPF0109 family)